MDLIPPPKGSTLLELLVVLGIIAALGSICTVMLPPLLEEKQAQRDLRQVVLALEQGKVCAASYKAEYAVNVQRTALRGESSAPPPCTRNVTVLSSNSHIEEPTEIVFYASGASTPRTLSLQHRNRTCEIKVSLRGRITSSCRSL
jgi:type II secretory pathway pseudopilin PulG